MNPAADFASITGDGDAGFDSDRQAGQRAWADMRGMGSHAGGIEVDQGVELGIEAPDLPDVLVGKFSWRDRSASQECELFGGRAERDGNGLGHEAGRKQIIISTQC